MIYKQIPQVDAAASQDPPLRMEVDNLERTVIFLNERLQVLEERLYSVLQEPPLVEQRLAKDVNGYSAMTRKIYEINTELRASTHRIENLIERLEI